MASQHRPALPPPCTVTLAQFAAKLGVSRGTLHTMRTRPGSDLPQPLPTGLKMKLFRESEVDAYCEFGSLWKLR